MTRDVSGPSRACRRSQGARTRSPSSRRRAPPVYKPPTRSSTGRSRTRTPSAITNPTHSTSMIAETAGGQHRLRRPGAVQRHRLAQVRRALRAAVRAGRRGRRTSPLNTNPAQAQETASCSTPSCARRRSTPPTETRSSRSSSPGMPGRGRTCSRCKSGKFWLNPAIKPLPFDHRQGQRHPRLARLQEGVGKNPGGAGDDREVRQPAHKMGDYTVMVPDGLDPSTATASSRSSPTDWKQIGIQLHEQAGGDSGQAYGIETAGKYTKFDFATWDWAEYIDPELPALLHDPAPSGTAGATTSATIPLFNKQYLQQATLDRLRRRGRRSSGRWRPSRAGSALAPARR